MNPCSELNGMAERELNAFYNSVKKLFGREEAERSAREWVAEVASSVRVPQSVREWREITVNVTRKMAMRVEAVPAA